MVLDSAAYNDARDWDALASLYAADARLTRPSGVVAVGRDEIRAAYGGGDPDRRTRHVCTNLRVDVDGTRATASTTVMLAVWTATAGAGDGLPDVASIVLGEFEDVLVRTEGAWLITERVARFDVRLR